MGMCLMLQLEAEQLRAEISAARDWRDKHLGSWVDQVSRFAGSSYKGGAGSGVNPTGDPENFAYSYVALVLPKLVYDVPRVEIEADDPITDGMTSELLESAMNRWAMRSSIRKTFTRIATDMLFMYGVSMVTREPVKSLRRSDPHHMGTTPRVYRISPEHFILDPAADSVEEARYMGHSYAIDLEDLIEMAKDDEYYDANAIKELKVGGDDDYRFKYGERREIPDREQVVVTELWIPECELDDHPKDGKHNGSIVTIAEGGEGDVQIIAETRPYFGPPTGPYTVFGAYTVPSDQYPLGPMTAADQLIRELNTHLKSMGASASAYRRIVAVDSTATKLAQDIANKPDLVVVPVDNLDKDKVVQLEMGGVTQQQIGYTELTQNRLDRLTGLSEVMRGNIHGDTTATEVTTAATSAGVRISWIQQQFAQAVSEVLWNVGWYLWHDKQIEMPLGKEGMKISGGSSVKWKGGREDSYAAMSIRVQAHSMQRIDEALQQKRSVELLQLVMQVGQMAPSMPFVDWRKLLENVGDNLNMPDLGRIINIRGAAQQQQEAPAPPPTGGESVSPPSNVGDMLSAAARGSGAGSPRGRAIR
jgi:hypothetical protein